MSLSSEEKKSIASFILSILALTFAISALLVSIYNANKNDQFLSQLLYPTQKEKLSNQHPSVYDDKHFLKTAGFPVSNCADGQLISTFILTKGFSVTIPLYHDGASIICLNGKPSTLNGVLISDKELSLIEQDAINQSIKKSSTKNTPVSVSDFYTTDISEKDFKDSNSASHDVVDKASRSVIKMAGVPLQKCEDGKYIEVLALSKGFTYLLPLHSKGDSVTCLDNKPSLNGVVLTEKEISDIEKEIINESIKN